MLTVSRPLEDLHFFNEALRTEAATMRWHTITAKEKEIMVELQTFLTPDSAYKMDQQRRTNIIEMIKNHHAESSNMRDFVSRLINSCREDGDVRNELSRKTPGKQVLELWGLISGDYAGSGYTKYTSRIDELLRNLDEAKGQPEQMPIQRAGERVYRSNSMSSTDSWETTNSELQARAHKNSSEEGEAPSTPQATATALAATILAGLKQNTTATGKKTAP